MDRVGRLEKTENIDALFDRGFMPQFDFSEFFKKLDSPELQEQEGGEEDIGNLYFGSPSPYSDPNQQAKRQVQFQGRKKKYFACTICDDDLTIEKNTIFFFNLNHWVLLRAFNPIDKRGDEERERERKEEETL